MPSPRLSRQVLQLELGGIEPVPAILQLPAAAAPVPGVLLLHGFSSRKDRMADSIGRALSSRRVASVAIDLPLHGAREGGVEGLSLRNPIALVQRWKQAVREAHEAIQYLARHPSIDASKIGIAGYSLGAYISTIVAADDPLVQVIALAAGGDLPEQTPFAALVRTLADPQRAARALDGRPLLMMNGRYDTTITPSQARALYDAAQDPKELRWYNGGHWPPESAIAEVADWLADELNKPAANAGQARRRRA